MKNPPSGMQVTRRSFLAGMGGLALLRAKPLAAAAASAPAAPYATLVDIEKCIACGACVEACRERNGARFPQPRRPFPELYPPGTKAEDWSGQKSVIDRLTPYNWLYIETVRMVKDGKPLEINIPRRCMHCLTPPCAALCPWAAARRNPDSGTVVIDSDTCLGGAKCRAVCPWHVPQRQSGVGLYLDLMPRFGGNGVMYKCDRCADSWTRGELPACIEVCPEKVQSIGPRHEIVEEATALAAERGAYLYGLTDNGGTNTIYISPVPFAELAAHSTSGPGRPTLAPVPDAMQDAGSLARLMVVAPLMTLVAGAVQTGSAQSGEEKEGTEDAPKPVSPTGEGTPHGLREARWLKRLWVVVALLLGFTGLMQMPIATRYGLTRIPGLGWTGEYFTSFHMHYVLAALLLALGAYILARRWRLGARFPRLTFWGRVRAALVGGLVLTGAVPVLNAIPPLAFSETIMLVTVLGHLALAVTLGVVSLLLLLRGRGAWLERDGR